MLEEDEVSSTFNLVSTCCAAVMQAFYIQEIAISDDKGSNGAQGQQQGKKRKRVVSICQNICYSFLLHHCSQGASDAG